jgi:branched-chain amino acid transport system permease protein
VISGGTATLLGPVAGAAIVIIVKYSLNAIADALTVVLSDGAMILFGPSLGADIAVVVKNALNAVAVRWNLVLGIVFVTIITFMPEGLVPGSIRLWRATLQRLRASRGGKLRPGAPP